MKASITILIIILALNSAYSQEFGIKAGASITSIDFNNLGKDQPSKLGYTIGFGSILNIAESWSIQPEVIYANKGSEYVDLSYIRIPISLRYEVLPKFSVLIGPEFGYLLTENTGFEKFDFGISPSLQFKPVEKLNLNLRYYYGLYSLLSDRRLIDEMGRPIGELKAFNRALELSVMYFVF